MVETYRGPYMSGQEKKQYSILNAIKTLMNNDRSGFEYEVSQQIQNDIKKDVVKGILVPDMIFQRDLTAGSATAGGNTVGSPVINIVDMLRAKLVTARAGATILSNLTGNGAIKIPKQTATATTYWVTEGNAPTESQQTIGQETLTPSTLGAFTDISRQLVLQSSINIENFVRNDLAAILAEEIDRVVINGSGSGAEPTGILNTSGISIVGTSPAAPTYVTLIDLFKEVAESNAAKGSLAFVTNSAVITALLQVFTNSTYGEIPVVNSFSAELVGKVEGLGLPIFCSNLSPANLGSSTGATTGVQTLSSILFGNWEDVVIGEWSGVELLTDPYTYSTTGTVRIRALKDLAVCVRRPESFAAAKEIQV